MKINKWAEAKNNTYDGDDWGYYDQYDRYGTAQAPPPLQSPSTYVQVFDRTSPGGQYGEEYLDDEKIVAAEPHMSNAPLTVPSPPIIDNGRYDINVVATRSLGLQDSPPQNLHFCQQYGQRQLYGNPAPLQGSYSHALPKVYSYPS